MGSIKTRRASKMISAACAILVATNSIFTCLVSFRTCTEPVKLVLAGSTKSTQTSVASAIIRTSCTIWVALLTSFSILVEIKSSYTSITFGINCV